MKKVGLTRVLLIVVSVAIPLLSLGTYLRAYYVRSDVFDGEEKKEPVRYRMFTTEREKAFFRPAAILEGLFTGRRVETVDPSDAGI